jgi:hypothetical protein
MTEVEKKALAIYDVICASGQDRPSSGRSLDELMKALAEWRAKSPGLAALRKAPPEVQLAFLAQSLQWLRAEARLDRNLHVCSAIGEAVQVALDEAPRPLPEDLICRLLGQYRQAQASMARIYFPFERLLSLIIPDQVTEGMRSELQKLQPYFAPTPGGKTDERSRDIRDRVADLVRVGGERWIEPDRGPWSQIVFDEIHAKGEIARAGWEALLEHCRSLEQTVPGARWNKRTRELVAALGETDVVIAMLRWLALGPTPGQPSEARSPIEDSAYQKGAVWCLGLSPSHEVAVAVADFGLACLRKVPMLGAVSQKVGFACVQALGVMECSEAVAQLTRLRAKVKYSVARRLIEKSLKQAAGRNGLTVEQLEDISVGTYGLNAEGVAEIAIGDATATLRLGDDGRTGAAWRNADGKLLKSAPAHVRKAFPEEVRAVATGAKELEQAYSAQKARLESSFLTSRCMAVDHWRKYYVDHPLLGHLGRRLIWVFNDDQGWENSGICFGRNVLDSSGSAADLVKAKTVRLWHPLAADSEEVWRWRERVFTLGIRQPFRQAFREFYQVTDKERQTKMHSNRFAGIVMRQHQLASLCRVREWNYRLQGAGFDGVNVPTKEFSFWNMHVEFCVDLPSDRDMSLRDSGLAEQSGAGINLFIASDQVRFYRDRREIAVDEVPAILYSEVMRDIDLFTSLCAIGEDETWADQGDRGTGIFSEGLDVQEITATVALRADMLSRVLPYTTIADRCEMQKTWLEVRGQLGTYRIPLGWGGAALMADDGMRWLQIPQNLLDAVALDLSAVPIDLDYRTETVLRKAYVLADDWRIESGDLMRQLGSH